MNLDTNQTNDGLIKAANFVTNQLQNNNIEMYSTHNDGKSVAVERFIRTLKNKIHDFNIKNFVY